MLSGSMPSNSEKNLDHRLTDDVGQHIEPAAVRHADDGFMHVGVGGAVQNLIQNDHGRFGAFQRKALVADETRVQEMFELFGFDHALQRAHARCRGGRAASDCPVGSMRSCSQRFCSGIWMFMYSQPIFPQ